MIYIGYILTSDAGERVYNMYMHSLRKMQLPKSKPGDASPLGLSWNDLNKLVIQVMGALSAVSGFLIMLGNTTLAGMLFTVVVAFMAATKDNHWIVSDVAAIKREKNARLEGIIRDVSLVGVCLMFIGGFAADAKMGDKFKPAAVEKEEDSE